MISKQSLGIDNTSEISKENCQKKKTFIDTQMINGEEYSSRNFETRFKVQV